jgi:hypothetical protein
LQSDIQQAPLPDQSVPQEERACQAAHLAIFDKFAVYWLLGQLSSGLTPGRRSLVIEENRDGEALAPCATEDRWADIFSRHVLKNTDGLTMVAGKQSVRLSGKGKPL